MKSWQQVTPPTDEPRDWGRLAFDEGLARWRQFQEASYCEQGECDHRDGEEHTPMPEGAGYGCGGCDDCMVREVLIAAWPVMEAGIRSGDFD